MGICYVRGILGSLVFFCALAQDGLSSSVLGRSHLWEGGGSKVMVSQSPVPDTPTPVLPLLQAVQLRASHSPSLGMVL